MSTTSIGRRAETAAVTHLTQQGFVLVAQNWRTRWCEIDIVASKASTIYFVEVKYRRTEGWGSGLDYITPQKLQRMHFAAKIWVHANNWRGDYMLSAMEVSGHEFAITQWLESVAA